MANSDVKIHHFDENGRAEVSRLILVLAGKPFQDVRIPRQEWPKVKPTTPFGQVPVLEIDGEKCAQGLAISAYLAKEFDFYGETNKDILNIDMISHLVFDFRCQAAQYYLENNGPSNSEIGRTITEEHVPKYLGYLEGLLKQNGGKFMVGNRLSLADVTVYDMFTGFLGEFVAASSADCLLLRELVDKFRNLEQIKKYST